MGGLDGKMYSNSFVFNKVLSWRGVLIEIISSNYRKLVENRPHEIAQIHAGVCSTPQKLHYYNNPEEHEGAVGGIQVCFSVLS